MGGVKRRESWDPDGGQFGGETKEILGRPACGRRDGGGAGGVGEEGRKG